MFFNDMCQSFEMMLCNLSKIDKLNFLLFSYSIVQCKNNLDRRKCLQNSCTIMLFFYLSSWMATCK